MRIRRPWLALAVLLIPTAARADDHRADRFAAFSRAGGSSLFGVHLTDAVTLPKPTNKDLALLGDFGVHFGSHDDDDVTRITFMGGLRFTFAPDAAQQPKFLPFVHVLLGGVYAHTGAGKGTDPAVALGGGLDYVPRRSRPREAWAIRLQGDYIVSGGDNFLRISAGVVYRFKK